MAGPAPLVIGAVVPKGAQAGGGHHRQGKRVAALGVEEFQGLLADVVRTELHKALDPPPREPDASADTSGWRHADAQGHRQRQPTPTDSGSGSNTPRRRDVDKISQSLAVEIGVWEREEEKPRLLDTVMALHPRLEGSLKRWVRLWDWFAHDLREPPRSGALATVVESKAFEVFFSSVIVLNALFMAGSMNHQVSRPAAGPSGFMQLAEAVFLALYCVELAMKIVVRRGFFFWSADMSWNILDFVLVVYGIVDMAIEYGSGTRGNAPAWMRALRLFKMAKVLRMLRVIRCLKELHLIMACILGSLRSLGWSLVMMAIILYMFSLVFVQQAAAYLAELQASDPEVAAGFRENFGSVQLSIVTLFKTLYGGDDWSVFYDLMAEASPVAQILFLFFVAFSQIALLNILTGIFVESAMKLAEPDHFEKADEHHATEHDQAKVLKDMCAQWDVNDSGGLSREEFAEMMKARRAKKYLHYLGLQVASAETVFNMLASLNGDEVVNIDRFVDGCMRMRGVAKSSDVNQLLFEVRCRHADDAARLRSDVNAIRQHVAVLAAQASKGPPSGSDTAIAPPRCRTELGAHRRQCCDDVDRSLDGGASAASTSASARQVHVSFWGMPGGHHSCLPLLPS